MVKSFSKTKSFERRKTKQDFNWKGKEIERVD